MLCLTEFCSSAVCGFWVMEHAGNRSPLVPLTLHSMKPPSQNRKFILALYRAHQMYLIPNGQRRIWVTLRGTRCHPDTRVWTLQMCPEAAAQFRALQELLSSAEVIYSANLLICSPPQQIINIQHKPLSSLALSQLWVLRVYRFSSQILQLYMIPPTHTLSPVATKQQQEHLLLHILTA